MENAIPAISNIRIMKRYLSTSRVYKQTIYLFEIMSQHEQAPRLDWFCFDWWYDLFLDRHGG